MFDRGENRGLEFQNLSLQVDELGDPAAGPGDPPLERGDGVVVSELELISLAIAQRRRQLPDPSS